MPKYRVYYVEYTPKDSWEAGVPLVERRYPPPRNYYQQTEWQEEVEAGTPAAALDDFFRDRLRDNSDLHWVDEEGQSQPVQGLTLDPDLTYIWIEADKLMEYQGIYEATPGMVTCPLCGGSGEVEESIAQEYETESEEEGEEGGSTS